MTGIMEGKKGIIFGVANDHSMAWGIAKALHDEGAEIALNYMGDIMEKRVRPLGESINAPVIMPANVQDDASLDAFFAEVEKKFGKIDFLLHAVAFSNKEELSGLFVEKTTRENFKNTMDISVYSFCDLCRRASKIMNEGGSCATLTYLGGEYYIPNYNVMCCISCRTVNLGAVLSGESSAAVTGISAVGVNDDLTSGKTCIAVRSSDHETSGRIDEYLCVGINHVLWKNGIEYVFLDVFVDLLLGNIFIVLG